MSSLKTLNKHKNRKLRRNVKQFAFLSSLPGRALRTHVKSLGKPRDVNKRSQSLPPSILYNHAKKQHKPCDETGPLSTPPSWFFKTAVRMYSFKVRPFFLSFSILLVDL